MPTPSNRRNGMNYDEWLQLTPEPIAEDVMAWLDQRLIDTYDENWPAFLALVQEFNLQDEVEI